MRGIKARWEGALAAPWSLWHTRDASVVPNPTSHMVMTANGARFRPRASRKASHVDSERVCRVGVRMAVKVLAGRAAGDARSLSLPDVSSDGPQIQCDREGREQQSGL